MCFDLENSCRDDQRSKKEPNRLEFDRERGASRVRKKNRGETPGFLSRFPGHCATRAVSSRAGLVASSRRVARSQVRRLDEANYDSANGDLIEYDESDASSIHDAFERHDVSD